MTPQVCVALRALQAIHPYPVAYATGKGYVGLRPEPLFDQ